MDALIPNLLSTPIWGDVYSIVLTIKRKALSRGNFAEVLWEITN